MIKVLLSVSVLVWVSAGPVQGVLDNEDDPARGAYHLTVTPQESAENERELLVSLAKDGEVGVHQDRCPVLRWRQLERLCRQQDLFRPEDFMALFGTHLLSPSMVTSLRAEKVNINTQ